MIVEKIGENTLQITDEVIIIQGKDELLINKKYFEEEIKKL